jgi:hypothetical protein
MPFVMLFGLPKDTHEDHLILLRQQIVEIVHQVMQVPIWWVRPFVVPDLFPAPTSEEDGSKTIYIRIDTGMFFEKPETFSKEVVVAVAQLVWKFYNGEYEIECFIGSLNPEWKSLIEAVKRPVNNL